MCNVHLQKRGKTNLEGEKKVGILINKNTKRRTQILEVGDSHLQKKEKKTNLRGERKKRQISEVKEKKEKKTNLRGERKKGEKDKSPR